ncbi:hypothetical protein, partial [Pseudomonas syringae group genomosp. 7]
RHVDKQLGPHIVADFTEPPEIQGHREGREAGNHHNRLAIDRDANDFIVINQHRSSEEDVKHGLQELKKETDIITKN